MIDTAKSPVLPAKPGGGGHYALLDGLRGLAACAVMGMHCGYWLSPQGLFGHAYLAVDFFFLLSGFVIAHSYQGRLESRKLSLLQFLRARFVRLYPLIALGAVVAGAYFMARWLSGHRTPSLDAIVDAVWRGAALAPRLTASPIGDQAFPLNGPLWSLFYELVVNVIYGLFYRHMRPRLLAVVVLLSGMTLILAVASQGHLDLGVSVETFAWGTARVTFGFFGGVLIQQLSSKGLVRLPRVHPMIIVLLLFAVFLAPRAWPLRWAMDLGAVLILFPLILLSSLSTPVSGGAKVLCKISGDLSYPIYVLQQPILWWLGGVYRVYEERLHAPVPGMAAMIIVCVIAWLALKLYDEPVRRFLSPSRKPAASRAALQEKAS
ncbi:acyltransferase [soil metagenome]